MLPAISYSRQHQSNSYISILFKGLVTITGSCTTEAMLSYLDIETLCSTWECNEDNITTLYSLFNLLYIEFSFNNNWCQTYCVTKISHVNWVFFLRATCDRLLFCSLACHWFGDLNCILPQLFSG